MFLALVFIVLGLFLLLNALGIIVSSNFWTLLLAVLFLAMGFRLLIKRGKCPMCGWQHLGGKMHSKIHERMDEDCCGCGHEHEHHEAEDEEEQN